MPFSFETTIALMNNAVNELSRAARDFGDERPDDDALAGELRDLLQHVADVMTKLTDERDLVAARGTSEHAVVIRDVKRDPDGMASPGHDLPAGVTAKTIEADKAAVAKANEEAAAKAAAARAAATPQVVTVVPAAPPADPKDGDKAKK